MTQSRNQELVGMVKKLEMEVETKSIREKELLAELKVLRGKVALRTKKVCMNTRASKAPLLLPNLFLSAATRIWCLCDILCPDGASPNI